MVFTLNNKRLYSHKRQVNLACAFFEGEGEVFIEKILNANLGQKKINRVK